MTMWMVRAERESRLFQPFQDNGLVAIGWEDVGDLSKLGSREAIFAAVEAHYPEWHVQKQRNVAGMLYRICTEISPADHVITYDQGRRVYAVGEITGPYRFDPSFEPEDPHVRPCRWVGEISRDELTLPTRNALGAIQTLFLLPAEAEADVQRALQGKPREAALDDNGIEEQEILHDVEARSLEFIKDQISRLSWDDMQELVAGLLRAMGYKTRVSPTGPDRGKDIIASPDGFGFEDPRIVVEVKHRRDAMGSQEIRSFLGGRHQNDKGLYVSTGGFTREAFYEADRASIPITLMDLEELVKAVVDYYDNMDIETQRILPLKRLYWPAE